MRPSRGNQWNWRYGSRSDGGRGHGTGGFTHTRPQSTEPRMTWAQWSKIGNDQDGGGRHALSPDILTHGLPPDPTPSDTYCDKWKKLIVSEFHASLSEFLGNHKSSREDFDDRAHVHVDFLRKDPRAPTYEVQVCTHAVTEPGAVTWEAKTSTPITPADLAKMLLKTKAGWLYITGCEDATTFPVKATAIAYDASFLRVDMPSKPGRGIAFESLTTLIYRFESLSAYPTETNPHIQKVIESGKIESWPEDTGVLKPVAEDARSQSKLNDSQFDILTKICAPVDFVQGPPGTGKSTFIVEYIKTRLPTTGDSRVLICTTTNKAIDSLTEKLAAAGYGDAMLAVGNDSRLGDTSKRFLVPNRVKTHATVLTFVREVVEPLSTLTSKYEDCLRDYKRLKLLQKLHDTTNDVEDETRRAKEALQGACLALRSSVQEVVSFLHDLRDDLLFDKKLLALIDQAQTSMANATEARDLIDAICRYRTVVSEAANTVRATVRKHIILTARYVVCTAAVAATLPDRLAQEMKRCASDADTTLSEGFDGLSFEQPPTYTFEYVILDEAGAMLEPDVVGTIVHGCRSLLCVGDHRQLPPFTKWRWAGSFGYDVSLMFRLSQHAADNYNMMTTQYRMHPHLADIVSSQFYGSALLTAASTSLERTRPEPVVFVDVNAQEQKSGTSFLNRDEIAAVLELVQQERRAAPDLIVNVICFHKPQFNAIRLELKRRGLIRDDTAGGSLPTLDVCTVDLMQGREADVVILSCVRTNTRTIGFLANKNRINVALSRAKQVLYIVGNRKALSTDPTWRAVLNHRHVSRK